jgi:hypothetical protein
MQPQLQSRARSTRCQLQTYAPQHLPVGLLLQRLSKEVDRLRFLPLLCCR